MYEANKELLRRAWAAYDHGDIDAFSACLTDDWREYDLLGQSEGVQEGFTSMDAHRIAFPDKSTEIVDIIAEGDFVVTNTITRATHTGQYLDLAPTGLKTVVYVISIHTIRDGRITKTVEANMGSGIYQQLTGRPAPEGQDNIG